MSKRPFCVIGGEIISNVPTIEELAVYIKDYIKNDVYSSAWSSDTVNAATRQAIYNIMQQVVGQLEYKGMWDASGGVYPSNPELGWYYVINVGGVINAIIFEVGDWIIWNGTGWDKLSSEITTEILYHIGEHAVLGNVHHVEYTDAKAISAIENESTLDLKGILKVGDSTAIQSIIDLGTGVTDYAKIIVDGEELIRLRKLGDSSIKGNFLPFNTLSSELGMNSKIWLSLFLEKLYDKNGILLATLDDALVMNNKKVTGLATPTVGTDAATKTYVDTHLPIGAIIMYSGTWVDNTTIVGWYKCDGANGTVNLVNKFVRGGTTSGTTGGSDNAVIVTHNHKDSWSSSLNAAAGGGKYAHDVARQDGTVTTSTGVSGTGKNIPAYYQLIFIQRIS